MHRRVFFITALMLISLTFCVSSSELYSDIDPLIDPEQVNLDSPRPLRHSTQISEAPVHNTALPVLQTVSGLEQEQTQQLIKYYSSPQRIRWLNTVMLRAEPYLAFIRQEVEIRSLPPELIYIPLIESEFITTARSHSGAAGLWQFMPNSIASLDMKITEWHDERYDFWKSTVGALKKLEENYRVLNDWPLAIAAYNAGLGAIQNAVKKTGIRDYWQLISKKHLKTETALFVPKLLAISYILSHPREFDLEMLWPQQVTWQQIPVSTQMDLGLLSHASGISYEDLKRANSELTRGITPPDSRYHLKVRTEDAQKVQDVLARTDLSLTKYHVYTIRSGDTLSELARYYGVPVQQIIAANPGVQPTALQIGSQLMIPAFNDNSAYSGTAHTAITTVSFNGMHLVKKGETLYSIALAYRTTPEILAQENGMEITDVLREGKTLKTPTH
ncbi:MAG: LysM peptidoglycan-binding domain-containing protein [Treponema sp.]|jgi:membrane-bound lytic murein transglycosylase D|nr:LysM peptidoglycan-binding domain-containing protein [Treponema sp.]